MEELKYPVGKFTYNAEPDFKKIQECIEVIKNLPGKLNEAVKGMDEAQFNTKYREGGWTVKQVIHHIADSHVNAFIRFKLALTEDNPTIKPYIQDKWAELEDSKKVPAATSLKLIEAVHERWTVILQSMTEQDFQKTYFHPENKKLYKLTEVISLYSWHSSHHLAHITSLKNRMNW